MLSHFEKHKGQMMARSGRTSYGVDDYLVDIDRVIETGTRVRLQGGPHSGSVVSVRFAGSDCKGKAVMEVVGLTPDGRVATFTFKIARQLQNWGMAVVR